MLINNILNNCNIILVPVQHNYTNYIDKFPLIDIQLINSYHQINDRAINFISQLLQKYYLAHILSLSPTRLVIKTNEYNKPFLSSHPELKFNISHSHDYVVLAYNMNESNIQIGVDIEYIDYQLDINEIKHIVFSKSEIKLIDDSINPHDSFFRLWTKKESLIKALGTGFGTNDYQATNLNLNMYEQHDNYILSTQLIAYKYYLTTCLIIKAIKAK